MVPQVRQGIWPFGGAGDAVSLPRLYTMPIVHPPFSFVRSHKRHASIIASRRVIPCMAALLRICRWRSTGERHRA